MATIDVSKVFNAILPGEQTRVNITLITVNVWDFGPLETAITTLQRGGLPTFTTTFNHDSFIDIIHSTENEAIKKVRRS